MTTKHTWLSRLLRRQPSGSRSTFRPTFEILEDRRVPATFFVSNVNNTGAGSLRQAILDANALAGHDVIRFNVGANLGGPIRVTSPLPGISSPVTMDGSQLFLPGGIRIPNSTGRPLIEIDGSLAPNGTEGLRIDPGAEGSFIRGLVVNRFDDDGITLIASNITVQNCWVGLTFDGTGDAGNGAAGIRLVGSTSNNLIGGPTLALRNIISGQAVGIATGGGTGTKTNNTIQGNFIGTNVAGTAAIPNNFGIYFSNPIANTQIVGNVISGNSSYGIALDGSTVAGTLIKNNRIGVAANGTTALPNGIIGVLVAEGAHDNTIGGTAVGDGNLIAFNGEKGVVIGSDPNNLILDEPAGNGNRVLGNRIFGSFNTIFVSADGINFPAQDSLDADTGPNDLQNFPDLTSAIRSADGTTLTVAGTLSSKANRNYRIEVFFFNADNQVNNTIQDLTFVGSTTTTTNSSGAGTISATLPLPAALPTNARVLATATDLTTGDTSNNSVNIAATVAPMIKDDVLTPVITEGEAASLSGQLVNTDPDDFLTLRVNWGDGSRKESFHPGTEPFVVTHTYVENGTYNVTYEWFAQVGGIKSRTKQVTVLNVAPELVTAQITPVAPRFGIYTLSGLATDAGLRDRLSVTVSWGDGKTDTVNLGRLRTFALVHRYVQPGSYEVTVTVTDDDGDSGSSLTLTAVVQSQLVP